MKIRKLTALLLLPALLLGLLGACAVRADDVAFTTVQRVPAPAQSASPAGASASPAPAQSEPRPGVNTADSYQALFDAGDFAALRMDFKAEPAIAEEAGAVNGGPSADSMDAASAYSADFSGTNRQTEGVDEADFLKTDGTFLYHLSGSTLRVFRADGAQTALVSETEVGTGEKVGTWHESSYPTGLYLAGDRLAVLFERYRALPCAGGGYYSERSTVGVRLYDISDPAAPALLSDSAQDGFLVDSRVTDGVLYLVSSYYVYDAVREEPMTYIPCRYEAGEQRLMACDCIYLPGEVRGSNGYAVVTALDLADGSTRGELSVLGGCSYIYMSAENLYLAARSTDRQSVETTDADGRPVIEVTATDRTHLVRIGTAGGALSLAAACSLEGRPLNQYSFDEAGGYLRAVLSTRVDHYTERTMPPDADEVLITTYISGQDEDSCALYVLDDALNVVSALTDIAEDERVYAVRFDGEMVYFVTFRETDPLFAADLTDPAAPVIRSALKLPGYSSYLHLWSDGLLFGLGQMMDEETGSREGVKLAMYDSSDPDALREITCLTTQWTYSPAEDEAHAIFLDASRGRVGFPVRDFRAGQGYALYAWEDGAFTELGFYAQEGWVYTMRAARVGNVLYIAGESALTAVSLDDGATLCELVFA